MTEEQWQAVFEYMLQEHDVILLEGDRWTLEHILAITKIIKP